MDRLAIFVEGYTKVLFVEKLIEEMAGIHKVMIEQREARGGRTVRRTLRLIKAAKPVTGEEYFVLIVDCGGDDQVKTRILEEHASLTRQGYSRIIGVRDVRPRFTHADIPRLEANLPLYIKTSLISVQFVLAIMEIEAWFLAEATHFERIDPTITVGAIKAALGFDPENDDMERRLSPADDLARCYALAGKSYRKSMASTTVNALDFANVYAGIGRRIQYLGRLLTSIEGFLA